MMPLRVVLNRRNATSLDSVADQDPGAILIERKAGELTTQYRHVVPIRFAHRKAETAPLVGKRLQVLYL